MKHPNKLPFIGVLAILDEPSDKSPSGARGHRVVLLRKAAEDALGSLIGMGVNCSDGQKHAAESKQGVIESAEIVGNELQVSGYIWNRDCPNVVSSIAAEKEEYGMSYEVTDAHVEDMRAETWRLAKVTFTGAAILRRDRAAYRKTSFMFVE